MYRNPSHPTACAEARVIVTGGQFPAALAALRSLRRAGFEPVAVTTMRATYAQFTRSVARVVRAPDVAVSASRFVEVIADECRNGPTVVIPGTEPELVALVEWNHLLPQTVLGLPELAALTRVSDKIQLYEAAPAAGFQVPDMRVVDDATNGGDVLVFPVVAKPVCSAVRRGDTLVSASAQLVEDAEGLRRFVGELPDHRAIVQPLLRGDLCALAGVMWNGSLHAATQQVALAVYPEPCGGSAVARTVPVERAVVARLEQLLRDARWEGIVQLQWIRNGDGDHVIDLNPRIYGSLALANAAGAELVAFWATLLLGGALPPEIPYRSVLYRNLETFARANGAPKPHDRPARRVSSVYSRTDPLPLLGSAARGLRKVRRELQSN
jgi:predicted ATP-grasp superfamily ATP-dependent carboligase